MELWYVGNDILNRMENVFKLKWIHGTTIELRSINIVIYSDTIFVIYTMELYSFYLIIELSLSD